MEEGCRLAVFSFSRKSVFGETLRNTGRVCRPLLPVEPALQRLWLPEPRTQEPQDSWVDLPCVRGVPRARPQRREEHSRRGWTGARGANRV